jgi:hypothetical protein
MHADASTDPHHFAVELLADFPHDSAMLVHRESDGQTAKRSKDWWNQVLATRYSRNTRSRDAIDFSILTGWRDTVSPEAWRWPWSAPAIRAS